MLVVKELLYHGKIRVDSRQPRLYASGNLQTVTGPKEMVNTVHILGFNAGSSGVFHTDLTGGMLLGQLAHPLVDDGRILVITLRRVEFHDLCHTGITPAAGEFPVNLHNSTMDLDAKEILGLSGYRDGGLESDQALDAAHRTFPDEGIARPRAAV